MEEKKMSFDRRHDFHGKTVDEAMKALRKALKNGQLKDLAPHVTITIQGSQLSPEAREYFANLPV